MTTNNFVLLAKTRRHQIVDYLRDEIVSGRLSPGERLRELELSSRLGVSRGPIREALRELEKDGLVQVKSYSGTIVASLSREEVCEVYQVRSAIEKKAFELLWPRRDRGYKHEFVRRHDALLAAIAKQDVVEIVAAEMCFHRYPYERADNHLLLAVWEQLAQRIRVSILLHRDAFIAREGYERAHVRYLKAAVGDDLQAMLREIDKHLETGMAMIDTWFGREQSLASGRTRNGHTRVVSTREGPQPE